MTGVGSSQKLFTSGFTNKILVFNVVDNNAAGHGVPSINLDEEIEIEEGAMSYAFYSPRHSSLYAVHEGPWNGNGSVARWSVDLTGKKPTFTRKEAREIKPSVLLTSPQSRHALVFHDDVLS